MADTDKKDERPPESPTTARELDFDDDDIPVSPKPSKPTSQIVPPTGTTQAPKTEVPQSQPAPPRDSRQEAEATLKEAFPTIDATVVKAVLVASGWQVEPAFNALLGMSDPDAQLHEPEPAPPPQPPRPTSRPPKDPKDMSQMERDELYARQLAQEYNVRPTYDSTQRSGSGQYRSQDPRTQPRDRRQQPPRQNRPYNEYDDQERNFFDDDLPEIGANIKKGFTDTQAKVNSFISNLMKKIDGEDEDDDVPPPQPPRRTGPGQQANPSFGSRRSGEAGRRSADYDRYDADPQLLGDDFSQLQMHDNDSLTPQQRRAARPAANPDLFKPTPAVPQSGRKVSFQDDDLYRGSPDSAKRVASPGSKTSKWQPLQTINPDPEIDHDPFSVGDDEDEEAKKKDLKPQDSERLKSATAETIKDGGVEEAKKELKPQETVGTKNKDAEEVLADKS